MIFKKRFLPLLILICILAVFCGCEGNNSDNSSDASVVSDASIPNESSGENGVSEPNGNHSLLDSMVTEMLSIKESFSGKYKELIDDDFVRWLAKNTGVETLTRLINTSKKKQMDDETVYDITGLTYHAAKALYNGDTQNLTVIGDTENKITEIVMVGDILFDKRYAVMRKYTETGINGILSQESQRILKEADIVLADNEFPYTERGKKNPNKEYSFRADPSAVNILKEMSIDIVTLANNHITDFGEISLLDTLDTLDTAGIRHIGAGRNIAEASAAYSYIINGRKIAFIAASAVDYIYTLQADTDSAGAFYMFKPDNAVEAIKKAKSENDIVIFMGHWGTESTTQLSWSQLGHSKLFVDAGADAVIGCHAHVLQGFDYYNGKFIAYGLGNFIFSGYNLTSSILKLNIDKDGNINPVIVPCMQRSTCNTVCTGDEYTYMINHIRKISGSGVKVGDDGSLRAA